MVDHGSCEEQEIVVVPSESSRGRQQGGSVDRNVDTENCRTHDGSPMTVEVHEILTSWRTLKMIEIVKAWMILKKLTRPLLLFFFC